MCRKKGFEMGKATQDLKNEHEAILPVLAIVNNAVSNDALEKDKLLKFGNELVYFLKIFADKCHHGKEENILFPELVKKGVPNEGGPIGVMLREHVQGREYIALMSGSLDAKDLAGFKTNAEKYRDLLISHIAKENDVLFVMADKLLDDKKQDELYQKFEEHEENVIGHGVHEELHAMIHKWEVEFGN
jgi:hemerythrin-like domain-containing protein